MEMTYHLEGCAEALGLTKLELVQFLRRIRAFFSETPKTRITESQLIAIAVLHEAILENPKVASRYVASTFSLFQGVCPWKLPSPFIGFVKDTQEAIFVPLDERGTFRQREALRITEPRDVSKLCLKLHLDCEGEMAEWHGKTSEEISAIYAKRRKLPE